MYEFFKNSTDDNIIEGVNIKESKKEFEILQSNSIHPQVSKGKLNETVSDIFDDNMNRLQNFYNMYLNSYNNDVKEYHNTHEILSFDEFNEISIPSSIKFKNTQRIKLSDQSLIECTSELLPNIVHLNFNILTDYFKYAHSYSPIIQPTVLIYCIKNRTLSPGLLLTIYALTFLFSPNQNKLLADFYFDKAEQYLTCNISSSDIQNVHTTYLLSNYYKSLSGNLSGSIPPEIDNLSYLEYLEYLFISNNGFSGSIPKKILNNNIIIYNKYNDKNKQVIEKEEKNDLNKDNKPNKETDENKSNDLNKEAKSNRGGFSFLKIVIEFGIISIVLSILLFLVLRKNKNLKKKNNESNSFSILSNAQINILSTSGNAESTINPPDVAFTPLHSSKNKFTNITITTTDIDNDNDNNNNNNNSNNDDSYGNRNNDKSLNNTNNNNNNIIIINVGEDLPPSYEDVLNENCENNTGNI
ncbi:hypothetical protein BCR36DRAFT_375507 [Piromyces finnis]|uniref:L domain-like protein n=1 Tax=Piromyces finnis TaxID=1754191 RepID=A0A1Y1UQK8_9FUNG|nr:hypothetical protein BCR36DRAFT_375507 [Piromyces finnis]|eukprot:ORX40350.1 hypothetical protein BCR36DRAFT_375507 [Piromyces finnis]